MNINKFVSLFAVLFLMQSNAMAIEEPNYEVIEANEDFELRRYQPYLVAEIDVSGGMNKSANNAFRVLAGYIFGGNEAAAKMKMTAPVETRAISEKMAMTAPVTSTKIAGEEQTTVAFVMEEKYTMDTLPIPNDKRIRIREVSERMVAVRRYSGRWTEAKYRKNEDLLTDALSKANIETVGEPTLARYNSPFSLPVLRRNEVMFEIVSSDAAQLIE